MGKPIDIEGKPWRSKGRKKNFTNALCEIQCARMFITTMDEENRSAHWSNPRESLVVQRPVCQAGGH